MPLECFEFFFCRAANLTKQTTILNSYTRSYFISNTTAKYCFAVLQRTQCVSYTMAMLSVKPIMYYLSTKLMGRANKKLILYFISLGKASDTSTTPFALYYIQSRLRGLVSVLLPYRCASTNQQFLCVSLPLASIK